MGLVPVACRTDHCCSCGQCAQPISSYQVSLASIKQKHLYRLSSFSMSFSRFCIVRRCCCWTRSRWIWMWWGAWICFSFLWRSAATGGPPSSMPPTSLMASRSGSHTWRLYQRGASKKVGFSPENLASLALIRRSVAPWFWKLAASIHWQHMAFPG